MLDPVGPSVVFVKCTCNISPDHSVSDIREPGRLLIHLLAAFYNNYLKNILIH